MTAPVPMRPSLAVLFIALAGLAVARADEPLKKESGVGLTFLPPPMEGRISLGIYDAKGKLVRVLHREAPMDRLTATADGLMTVWNGRDDVGAPLPAGRYSARGYVVGDLKVESVGFHFNDWVADSSSPRIGAVDALQILPGGDLVVLATLADGSRALLRYGTDGALAWRFPFEREPGPRFIAAGGELIFLASPTRLRAFHARDGAECALEGLPQLEAITALSSDASSLRVFDSGKILRFKTNGFAPAGEEPDGRSAEAATQTGEALIILHEGAVVAREQGAWRKLELPGLGRALDCAFGKGGLVWLIDRQGDAAELKQFSLAGEFLRRLAVAEGQPSPKKLTASTGEDRLYLLEENPQFQRVRGLLLTEVKGDGPDNKVSKWQVFFQKAIAAHSAFAIENGGPVAAREPVPAAKVSVKLVENPLLNRRPPPAEVTADFDETGAFLRLTDGLPLARVGNAKGLRAVALAPGANADLLTVFQDDGAAVEELRVSGVKNMMAFDVGAFDLRRQSPD